MNNSAPTATTISSWLRRSGTLPCGSVSNVCVELELETSVSKLLFLTASYSPEAPSDLARHLVVKTSLTPRKVPDVGSAEVQFYLRYASLLGTPPTVRCLAAIEADDDNAATVVLEDLRATHDHRPWPLPPTRTECQLALDALVRVHAQWWEAPALGHTVGNLHRPESLTSMVQGISRHLPAFIDALGDALTTETHHVFERVFSSSLRPWLRLINPRALTVTHGDAHAWNFLFPRSGEGAAFLIDWQVWHLDLGARDLAFLMALHWYPSRRRELERPLLRYYHEGLVASGINNYAFDDLWLDYRLCAVRNLTIPLLFWSRGMKPEGWWHRLECAVSAYRDLGCDELL